MMKFFRKYNKHLLAIFMVLLLIVWLGGEAIQNVFSPNPAKASIGTIGGETLIQADLAAAATETRILGSLNLAWMKPWIGSASQARFDFNEPIDEMDWLLLRHEAERLGLGITDSQVERFKQGVGLTPNDIARLASVHGVSAAAIDSAIASYLRVRSAFGEVQSSIFVSEPELRTVARDVGETVTIRWIGLPAEGFIDETETFDDARITAHFEKWKDTLPGEGDLGAGFRYPDRVEIEYIVAHSDAVAPTVAISRDEAKEHWQRNKDKYLRPMDDATDTQPAGDDATSQPAASQPAEPQKPLPYETFMEAEADVLAELRKGRAPVETQRVLGELLTTQFVGDWEGVEPDAKSGFIAAPDAVKGERYVEERVAAFVASHPAYASAFEVHRTPLLSADDLADIEGVGDASAPITGDTPFILQEILLAEDAFNVEGLVEMPKERANTRLPVSLYQFSAPSYRDDEDSFYAYRVVRVEPSAAPASLDEVREQVVRSLRIQSAFERARAAASELLTKADDSTLKLAWRDMGEIQTRIDGLRDTDDPKAQAWGEQLPPPFARRTYAGDAPPVRGIQSQELVDTCFELAAAFKPDGEKRPHSVVELPEHQLIVVAEVEDFKPLYEEDFQARRDRDERFIVMQRSRQLIADWFNRDNIRARVAYKPPA